MKILPNRTDRENFVFLIGMIVIIIGILALLLAYVFFPIHSNNANIGENAIANLAIELFLIAP